MTETASSYMSTRTVVPCYCIVKYLVLTVLFNGLIKLISAHRDAADAGITCSGSKLNMLHTARYQCTHAARFASPQQWQYIAVPFATAAVTAALS
jgi:hypothetical protein